MPAQYTLAELRRFRCYETAMVIAYARPFSMAKGQVRPLNFKDIGYSMTQAEKALDKKLIKHRNTLYGHSDAEAVEMRVMVMHQYFDHNGVDFNLVMPRFDEGMRFSLDEIKAIHEMMHKLHHAVFTKFQKLGVAFKDRFGTYEWDLSP